MIKIFLLVIIFIAFIVFLHIPILPLNEKEKNLIKKQGLIHFTSYTNALKIQSEGFKGCVSHMGGVERLLGKLIWFYPNTQDIEQKQKILLNTARGKEDRKRFEVYILVGNVDNEEIKKMRKRIGFSKSDKAIVYKGDRFIPNKMTIEKTEELEKIK